MLPCRELGAKRLQFLLYVIECVWTKQEMQRWFRRSQELCNYSTGFGWIIRLASASRLTRFSDWIEDRIVVGNLALPFASWNGLPSLSGTCRGSTEVT